MTTRLILLGLLLLFVVVALLLRKLRHAPPSTSDRLESIRRRVSGPLADSLKRERLQSGAPVFLRIFKEEKELELWMRDDMGGRYRLFRTWPIQGDGPTGPKRRNGDGTAPEGFYHVGRRQLKPKAKPHLAIDLGFPNAFDEFHRRGGDEATIHGGDTGDGGYALTDPVIEIVYLLVEAALRSRKQDEISVHCFPFRLTAERLEREKDSAWHGFWSNLKEGSDLFEQSRVPPLVGHHNGVYRFRRRDP